MDRLQYFAGLAGSAPDDPRARYGYANELYRAGRDEETVRELRAYLELAGGDEGSAYGRLGECLARLGRPLEAADAYLAGIEAARAHGHHGLADDLGAALEALEDPPGGP